MNIISNCIKKNITIIFIFITKEFFFYTRHSLERESEFICMSNFNCRIKYTSMVMSKSIKNGFTSTSFLINRIIYCNKWFKRTSIISILNLLFKVFTFFFRNILILCFIFKILKEELIHFYYISSHLTNIFWNIIRESFHDSLFIFHDNRSLLINHLNVTNHHSFILDFINISNFWNCNIYWFTFNRKQILNKTSRKIINIRRRNIFQTRNDDF